MLYNCKYMVVCCLWRERKILPKNSKTAIHRKYTVFNRHSIAPYEKPIPSHSYNINKKRCRICRYYFDKQYDWL